MNSPHVPQNHRQEIHAWLDQRLAALQESGDKLAKAQHVEAAAEIKQVELMLQEWKQALNELK